MAVAAADTRAEAGPHIAAAGFPEAVFVEVA
jgi:hypothetical protein